MKPIEAFLKLFGNVTVSQIVVWVLAIGFIITIGLKLYREIENWFKKKHEREEATLKLKIEKETREKQRDENVQKCLTAIENFGDFVTNSEKIHETLDGQIGELKKRLDEYDRQTKKREMNKIRNTLLQLYRQHTNLEINPNQTWTKLDSDTFWALAEEYEESGGNGVMKNEVFPAMRKLRIVG